MNNKGWIKLYRNLLDNDLWLLEPFTKGQAWVDLLLLANHKPALMTIKNGKVIELNRGDCGMSILGFAERWHWSRERVKRYFSLLESKKQVTKKEVENRVIISILNYEDYQDVTLNVTVNDTLNDTVNGTVNVTVNGHKQECKEEHKNEKNEKEVKESFLKFWNLCPKQIDEMKTYTLYETLIKNKKVTSDELIEGMKRYKSHCVRAGTESRFIKSPFKWLDESKWTDKYEVQNETRYNAFAVF